MATGMSGYLRVLLVAALLLLSGCKKYVDLHKQLDESDANEIVATLVSQGIEAKKEIRKEGFAVIIDERDMARAVNLLNARGLPRRHKTNFGEIFKKEGVISTPLEERARYIYALSQELEATLSEMDGVIVARVHVVLPERVAPGEPINPSSAAVFIKHKSDFDPDIYGTRVKQLVASSIPGLWNEKQNKIAVVYSASEGFESGTEWTLVGPFKVEAASAAGLKNLFVALLLLVPLILLGFILVPNERPRAWVITRLGNYFPQLTHRQ